MFRQGKPRSFRHNVRLASMLSFVAGMVNIIGVLAIDTFTTNVTGHFALFAEEFVERRYEPALTYLIFILFFLSGAFVSSLLVELVIRKRPSFSHAAPMFLEIGILMTVAFRHDTNSANFIACALLFAMGLQNSLVTKVSKATVRTTHLTGLFTDLGIELSQLFFYKQREDAVRLTSSIFLRLTIIFFFFIGGVGGGFAFYRFHLRGLLAAAAVLMIALLYDNIRFSLLLFTRRLFRHRA